MGFFTHVLKIFRPDTKPETDADGNIVYDDDGNIVLKSAMDGAKIDLTTWKYIRIA